MSTATDHGGPGRFVVEWREGFRTGIELVDTEHQHLFELVRRLDLANVRSLLDELVEYVVTHFTHEQALMEHSGYPGFQQHLGLHEELAAQVCGFLASGSGWTEERVQELRRFLNRWLVGHILTHDLRFAKWYQENARGLQACPAELPVRPRSRWLERLLGSPRQ